MYSVTRLPLACVLIPPEMGFFKNSRYEGRGNGSQAGPIRISGTHRSLIKPFNAAMTMTRRSSETIRIPRTQTAASGRLNLAVLHIPRSEYARVRVRLTLSKPDINSCEEE